MQNNYKEIFYRNRHVGTIILDKKIYFSKRDFNKHYFVKYSGIGMSMSVLDILLSYGVEDIVIGMNGKAYYATYSDFLVKGEEYTDLDNDKQLILNLKFFRNPNDILELVPRHQALLGLYK